MKRLLKCAILLMLTSACHQEDNQNCGCSGEISFTIEANDDQNGYLYKNTENSGDFLPDYNYGIWYAEPDCANCIHYFLVCNDKFLADPGDIPAYPGMEVTFSGQAKELCESPLSIPEYTYNQITLTSLQPL